MKKRLLASLMAAALALSVFAGCSGSNDTSSTASGTESSATSETASTDETSSEAGETSEVAETGGATTFTIACNAAGDVNPPMNEWWIWEEYESMTGIHIDWMEIPSTAVAEQKTLLLTSDDMPDAFWQINFTTDELNRYGSEGTFVNLATYMDEYAPNLKALLESIEGGMASVTMPDGGIYSMPWVMTDLPQANLRYYINQNWLDNLGLEVPTSIDELTAVLEAFKTEDANGNGDPDDEWGIYQSPENIASFEQQLAGSYGIGNHGKKPLDEWYYVDDETNEVQFLYTTDGMKQIWQQMAEWWANGYMHPETFGKPAYENWVTDGSVNDIVGLFSWVGADYLYSSAINDYTPIHVLTGPSGEEPVLSWTDYEVRGTSAFTITSACEDPATLIEWADYFYGEEGVQFSAFGKEGVTYNLDEEGNIRYTDEILNYEGGPQLGAYQYGLFVYGGSIPTWYVDSKPMEIARRQDDPSNTLEKYSEYVEISEQYKPDMLPGMVPTIDESTEINAMRTDIETYIKESRANFVTGTWNFDSDWDNFVAQLEGLGVSRYVEIKQAQYDRYLEANG